MDRNDKLTFILAALLVSAAGLPRIARAGEAMDQLRLASIAPDQAFENNNHAGTVSATAAPDDSAGPQSPSLIAAAPVSPRRGDTVRDPSGDAPQDKPTDWKTGAYALGGMAVGAGLGALLGLGAAGFIVGTLVAG